MYTKNRSDGDGVARALEELLSKHGLSSRSSASEIQVRMEGGWQRDPWEHAYGAMSWGMQGGYLSSSPILLRKQGSVACVQGRGREAAKKHAGQGREEAEKHGGLD